MHAVMPTKHSAKIPIRSLSDRRANSWGRLFNPGSSPTTLQICTSIADELCSSRQLVAPTGGYRRLNLRPHPGSKLMFPLPGTTPIDIACNEYDEASGSVSVRFTEDLIAGRFPHRKCLLHPESIRSPREPPRVCKHSHIVSSTAHRF
jgi:hypothetical protein